MQLSTRTIQSWHFSVHLVDPTHPTDPCDPKCPVDPERPADSPHPIDHTDPADPKNQIYRLDAINLDTRAKYTRQYTFQEIRWLSRPHKPLSADANILRDIFDPLICDGIVLDPPITKIRGDNLWVVFSLRLCAERCVPDNHAIILLLDMVDAGHVEDVKDAMDDMDAENAGHNVLQIKKELVETIHLNALIRDNMVDKLSAGIKRLGDRVDELVGENDQISSEMARSSGSLGGSVFELRGMFAQMEYQIKLLNAPIRVFQLPRAIHQCGVYCLDGYANDRKVCGYVGVDVPFMRSNEFEQWIDKTYGTSHYESYARCRSKGGFSLDPPYGQWHDKLRAYYFTETQKTHHRWHAIGLYILEKYNILPTILLKNSETFNEQSNSWLADHLLAQFPAYDYRDAMRGKSLDEIREFGLEKLAHLMHHYIDHAELQRDTGIYPRNAPIRL